MAAVKPYASRKIRDRAKQDRMCASYRSGRTLQQIGDEFGISRERVRQIIVAAGVTARDGGVRINAERRAHRKRVAKALKRDARMTFLYGCDFKTLLVLNEGLHRCARGSYAAAYLQQRRSAQHRGVAWTITFPQWMAVWRESGHLDERGRGRDLYCMARRGDKGAYAVGNVYITTVANNVSDYQAELKKRGVECSDGWKRLPEKSHRVSDTPRDEACGHGAKLGLGLGRGRGWTLVKSASRRPYQVTCRQKYVGSFATQQQAELAYRLACEEARTHR